MTNTPIPRTLRRAAVALAAGLLALPALAQITFYEHDGYRGRAVRASQAVQDFGSIGFNDRASSAVVEGGRWEVCDDSAYGGRCTVLLPGNYAALSAMGLNDRVTSARPADSRRGLQVQVPPAEPAYAYRRRPQERLFDAPVTSVRAVVGAPTERCWIEREQATARERPDVARGALGAVIGGVLGHQVGGGTGRDVATVGGAVVGGLIGANSGRDGGTPAREVRRCATTASTAPTYWDVGYVFRGTQHQLQMTTEPGATISVNRAGEPRV